MPRLKKIAPLSKPEKVRLSEDLKNRCMQVWQASNRSDRPFSDFLRELIKIGTNVYQKQILPAEQGDLRVPRTSRITPRAAKTGTDGR